MNILGNRPIIRIHKLSNLKKKKFREFQYLQTIEYRINLSIKWLLGNNSNFFFPEAIQLKVCGISGCPY